MRFFLALFTAKITSFIINLFKFGSGYTWPGHNALKVFPDVLNDHRILFRKGVVFVTGTNGKTTTTKIITHLLESQGQKVIHNATGANLLNGIVSQILLSMTLVGDLDADYGVFEVDEFSLPKVLEYIQPDVLAVLNLSRDQLDRYGETDIIFERWVKAFSRLNLGVKLVIDEETIEFENLKNMNLEYLTFDSSDELSSRTKLKGKFNAKNLNASLQILKILGYDSDILLDHMENFDFAYGRGELVDKFHIYLAKNPASFNNNLSVLPEFDSSNTALVVVLNDKIPDGRDVSWIYDIDPLQILSTFEPFFGEAHNFIFVSGTRAYDMATRLQYAGVSIDSDNIDNDLEKILNKVSQDFQFRNAVLLPNYSAMLESRKILIGRSIQ